MTLPDDFARRYGPWALVAGASEGTGAAFARQVARGGVNVALCSRRLEPLEELAADIRATTDAEVRVASIDLTSRTLMEDLEPLVEGLDIGLLVYNAGAESAAGNFVERPLQDALHLVDLNCRGPLVLTHRFGKEMTSRGRGGMVLMNSMAAGAGSAYTAVYSSTKAFERTLAEALWVELGQQGVDVVGVVAGLTDTPAMRAMPFAINHGSFPVMTAEDVAAEALAALPNGPMWIVGEDNLEQALHYWPIDRAEIVVGLSQGTAALFGFPVPQRPSHGSSQGDHERSS
jgi:short-subunit dehydrogenase